MLLAGWKALYLREGPLPARLQSVCGVEPGALSCGGFGHCGACHTPRNRLGAEKKDEYFAGAEVENWTVYPINANRRLRCPGTPRPHLLFAPWLARAPWCIPRADGAGDGQSGLVPEDDIERSPPM